MAISTEAPSRIHGEYSFCVLSFRFRLLCGCLSSDLQIHHHTSVITLVVLGRIILMACLVNTKLLPLPITISIRAFVHAIRVPSFCPSIDLTLKFSLPLPLAHLTLYCY